jgi:hypothetical protein
MIRTTGCLTEPRSRMHKSLYLCPLWACMIWYCGMSAESQNCETSRECRCQGTVGNRHVFAATVAHATIKELLEAVFSVWSAPRPCITTSNSSFREYMTCIFTSLLVGILHSHLPRVRFLVDIGNSSIYIYVHGLLPWVSCESVWSWQLEEMVASLREHEPGSRGTSAVGSRCQATLVTTEE